MFFQCLVEIGEEKLHFYTIMCSILAKFRLMKWRGHALELVVLVTEYG
jgi:hypothetical protein